MRRENRIYAPSIYVNALLFSAITILGGFSLVNLFHGEVFVGLGFLLVFFAFLAIYICADIFYHRD